MAKAIFFDLDGTLTDSGEGIINCAAYTLEYFGLPVPSREEMRVFVGPPLRDTFVKFGVSPNQTDKAVEVYRSRYIPIGKFENHPYPGIEDLLTRLKNEGYRLFVATSKPETTSIEILDKFGLSPYFEVIAGATMDGSRDEKAQVIAYLLGIVGKLDDTVMIGDTAFDVIGASTHGIPTIGVSWGYGLVSDMVSAGAKAIAHSMEELYTLLTK